MSDINVGAITEALNDKMDRDAHNVQPHLRLLLKKWTRQQKTIILGIVSILTAGLSKVVN